MKVKLLSLYWLGYVSEASTQQQQARSELTVDMDDVIHERGQNVSVYTNCLLNEVEYS